MEETTPEENCEVKMIPLTVDVSESFYLFMKEYLTFFGSQQTVEDLCRQMIYSEIRRLHVDLSEFVKNDSHHVGEIPWFKKFQYVAETTDYAPEETGENSDP